jgi:DNA-binding CsgD family transcriptional regulator/PAS domain-containing protein
MLFQIIGDIYDTALRASPWTGALEKAARFVGGPASSLFLEDTVSRWRSFAWEYGISPHYAGIYHQNYVRQAPAHVGRAMQDIDEPIVAADFVPYEVFLKTPFYRDWARPQGLVDFVVGVLDRSPSSVTLFSVFRDERDGVADAATRRRMRALTPHLRRAIHISKAIDAEQTETATFAAVLEGLSAAIFLMDASGGILHANAAGRAILAGDDFLYSSRGKLLARDAAADRRLRAEIAAAASRSVAGPSANGISLTSRDQQRYLAHVLPLAAGTAQRAGIANRAVAALFVHRRDLDALSPTGAIAEHYQLTPTELRVLLAIVNVGGGPEVAAALGIGSGTVKTHLHRLYEKTGAARQADLVKLVASFANPLLHAPAPGEAAPTVNRRQSAGLARVAIGGG